MRKIGLVALLALSGVFGFEHKIHGQFGSFTKWGFNDQKLNKNAGIAPTDSFSSVMGSLNYTAKFADLISITAGGALGGLAYDSTDNGASGPTQVQYTYFNANYEKGRAQGYMIQNVNIGIDHKNVYLRLGRYEAGKVGEWFSGFNEGAEGYVAFSDFKIWAFASGKRGFAYNQWFYEFYRVFGYGDTQPKREIYGAGFDYNTDKIKASLFAYGADSIFFAPGVSLDFDTAGGEENSVSSVTKVRVLVPIALGSNISGTDWGNGPNWGIIGKNTTTLWIDEKVRLGKYFVGAGVYKNFGNANELIGRYGNPLGSVVDVWTASAYDIGFALSDMLGRNALTGYLRAGASYGDFSWSILGRLTDSPRSAEQSLALLVNYKVRDDISVGGKLEGLMDTTKAGYSLNGHSLTANRTDDRSHLFFYISHTF